MLDLGRDADQRALEEQSASQEYMTAGNSYLKEREKAKAECDCLQDPARCPGFGWVRWSNAICFPVRPSFPRSRVASYPQADGI